MVQAHPSNGVGVQQKIDQVSGAEPGTLRRWSSMVSAILPDKGGVKAQQLSKF